ncbi:sugar transferase [Listeria booriae]|uniref:Sugar transferase n=2 Tax=Listeria booriae TaxID=1552123 RepID=A0A7X0WTM0_9LIST|nr:sugar transferase [Listeria booriae]MBC1228138.1 sugar transferase [Listeria booriae]MBC1234272.1 sugar transferase [Listeria booriae]MBC1271607.1 sugar transferase [Listeria booriae]MBC1317203.1 sugar transferase [Listeria booriae]
MYYEPSSAKRKMKQAEGKAMNRMIRLFDIIAALLAIIISAPITVIVALFIKLDDPKGPIFFRQKRIGKDQVPFYMYKFRSMHVDAEAKLEALLAENEMEGHMFKMKDDPRITKIGKFIRKTSLDEFPQFLNILKGDMSFVGPRPPLEREVAAYSEYDLQRLTVTPGCTGLWQVSGRNTLTFEEMVELDLKYIRERSMWLNIKILCATFKEFAGKGM